MTNYEVLRRLLKDVNGATFIGITTITTVHLKGGKKNPYQGRLKKKTVGDNVMVFQNKRTNAYENMVQNRLIEVGMDPTRFELSARPWGTRLKDCPFVEHKGEYYLEVIRLRHGYVEYLLDGKIPVNPATIEGWEDEKEEGKQGGLPAWKKVIIRTYKCSSIIGITVNNRFTLLKEGL